MNGLDNQLNFIAYFQIQVFDRLGGNDRSHLFDFDNLELDQRHDLVAFNGFDLRDDCISSAVFDGNLLCLNVKLLKSL